MSKIISISEAVSIALHGIILIARSEDIINVNVIAERTQSSRHHVAKVMQRLVKEGIIASTRGPRGGFRLLKNPQELTFLQLYEIIEGKIEITKCPMDKPVCPFDKCIMENVVSEMTNDFRSYLEEQKISSYM